MKKGTATALALSLIVAAIYAISNFASGDSAAIDYAGSAIGWMRNLLQKAKNLASSATGKTNAMDKALTIISGFETFSSKVYPDPPGQSVKYSIGYGHQLIAGDGFDLDSTITESDAWDLLSNDAQLAASTVDSSVVVQIDDDERAALYSLCYNIGRGNFVNSTLLRKLNAGDFEGADAEFGKWVYAKGIVSEGLQSRREQEAELFQQGIDESQG